MSTSTLDRSFYAQDPLVVARGLLGARLVRCLEGQRLAGLITETEAYWGEADQACHARAGLTPRTQVMYGLPGFSYVYFNYGVHWMLNVVTEPQGRPSAVLIRGIHPLEGLERIAALRLPPVVGRPRNRRGLVGVDLGVDPANEGGHIEGGHIGPPLQDPDGHGGPTRSDPDGVFIPGWTDGPAKVTQALAITGAFNGRDLCDPAGELWIEAGESFPEEQVRVGPRVGIHSVPEPWKSKPWRFLVQDGAALSNRR